MARQRKSGIELASLLDLSQTSASRRLLGQTAFSLDELATVADWLGVPVSNFIRSAA
jgi:transcriptional regulator with XRE-family HTH domain